MNDSAEHSRTQYLIASLEHVYALKSIPRSGWVQSGVPTSGVESIASHSYGMSLLILYLRKDLLAQGVNVERALNMALIHDMAESIVGDLTPRDKISESEKHAAEADALKQIIRGVQEGDYFQELWEDFESIASPEAQVVKRIDKLDMLIQAYLYENKYKMRLDSFWEDMDSRFLETECEPIYNFIRSNRFEVIRN